jgi:predicted SAM-dependent methyltransferase
MLHLGCGLDYLPEAINLDLHDITVADLQGDVLSLPLSSGCCSRVIARHLLEHLGYAGSIYALAEWHRVMEPGAALFVETPDRLDACQDLATATKDSEALNWAFGLSSPGYTHRTLFDETELLDVVQRAGFSQATISRHGAHRSVLRLRAQKTAGTASNLRACLHQGFVAAGILDPISAPPRFFHLERICDAVIGLVEGRDTKDPEEVLTRALGISARFSPRVSVVVLRSLVTAGIASYERCEPFVELARHLVDIQLPARLVNAVRHSAPVPGSQSSRIRQVSRSFDHYLAGLLVPEEPSLKAYRDYFESRLLTPEPDSAIDSFCPESLSLLARRSCALGQRAFARKDWPRAREFLELAVDFDADSPLPLWNLARLEMVEQRPLEAMGRYAALLELLPSLTDSLCPELDAVTGRTSGEWRRYARPVTGLPEDGAGQ